MHLTTIETKSHDDDLLLTWCEKVEHIIEIFFQYREIGCLFWSEVLIILDEVSECRILLAADRGVEREYILRYTHDLADLTDIHIELESELFHEWLTCELLSESSIRMVKLIDRLDHMDGDTDRTSLICDSTCHTLTDPPRRIGREFESSIWIELVYSTKESYISLLDEIEESETTPHILLCYRDDETEIGLSETLTSLLVSLLYEATKADFFLGIDEGEPTDLIEIHPDRVIRDLREVYILIFLSCIFEHLIMIERIHELDSELRQTRKYLIHQFDIISWWECCHHLIIDELSFGLSFFEEELHLLTHTFEVLFWDRHIDEFFEIFLSAFISKKIFRRSVIISFFFLGIFSIVIIEIEWIIEFIIEFIF